MNANDPTLQVNDIIEVRRIVGLPDAVTGVVEADVHIIASDKYVLKTTYLGLPGAKGDTSTFNDLTIESLADRFAGTPTTPDTSLTHNLQTLTDAVAAECRSLQAQVGVTGSLTTLDKTSLVNAVNELNAVISTAVSANGASISDTFVSNHTTWSSAKIFASVNGILAGVQSNLDTLAEIAAAINNDPNFFHDIQGQLDSKLSWDTPNQGLTEAQRINACANLGAVSVYDVGDTTVDFVGIFNEGLI